VILAQELDWRNRPVAGCTWRAEGQVNENRQDMIADLAAQIIISLKKSAITGDSRSYRYFCQGLQSLSMAEMPETRHRCDYIERARMHFQRALAHDPANWMARFYLAVCLCRCGEHEAAVGHMNILDASLRRADAALGAKKFRRIFRRKDRDVLVQHLQTYPQCPFLMMYNKAMSESGTLRACALEDALKVVEQLSLSVQARPKGKPEFPNCARDLKEPARKRFSMLAWSAKASILATQGEHQVGEAEGRARLELIREQLTDTFDQFEAFSANLEPELTSDHALGRATLLNAKGRVETACFRAHCGKFARKAEGCFREAQAYLPDLADSYLNLVRLYLCAKEEFGETWKAEAEKQLGELEQIAPGNAQAKYLKARVAAESDEGTAALSISKELPEMPEAHFIEAEVLSDSSFVGSDLKGAVKAWETGLAKVTEPNQFQVEHFMRLFEFALSGSQPESVISVANMAARRLMERGRCPQDRNVGAYWSTRLHCRRAA
jgi:hypothetical protein